MAPSQLLIVIVLGIGLLAAVEATYYLVLYRSEAQRLQLRRRLRSLAHPDMPSLLREGRVARSRGVERLLRALPITPRIETLLLQTELNWTVATVLSLSLALAVLVGLLSAILLRRLPALLWIGPPMAAAIPFLIILSARGQRSQKISVQMPDALDMVVRSLRAGHGLSSGLKLVAQEMPPPVAVEFGRCFEEQQLGLDFRDAVLNMTARVPGNLDLRIFAVSMLIQRDTGGNLIEILEKIADTIRERFKFYGKLRALTAEGRISGYILGSLPFLTLAAIAILQPKYLTPLATDPLGRVFVVVGLVLWLLGVLWMRKMSRVDY
jgi:tight adherence protein B